VITFVDIKYSFTKGGVYLLVHTLVRFFVCIFTDNFLNDFGTINHCND